MMQLPLSIAYVLSSFVLLSSGHILQIQKHYKSAAKSVTLDNGGGACTHLCPNLQLHSPPFSLATKENLNQLESICFPPPHIQHHNYRDRRNLKGLSCSILRDVSNPKLPQPSSFSLNTCNKPQSTTSQDSSFKCQTALTAHNVPLFFI